MITLKKFDEIIKTIRQFDEDTNNLTKILLKDMYGFIDYHFPLEKIINDLLINIFESDDPDIISWWMFENVDKIIEWNDKKYDLTSIEDLYYWLTKQYDKVKIL